MTLPPEIRNRIYLFVLGSRDIRTTARVPLRASEFDERQSRVLVHYPARKVENLTKTDWFLETQFLTKRTLNILLVCKHIYIEAFHVFYTSNRFYFPDTELLFSFLKGIGYNRRQHLAMIALNWCGPFAKEAFRLLKTCRRLRSVQFTIPCGEPPGYGAVREIRGLEQVLVIKRIHYSTMVAGHCRLASEDYVCKCRRNPLVKGPLDDVQELERAMMRPRLKQYAKDPSEEFNLFTVKREVSKKPEETFLLEDRATWYPTPFFRTRPSSLSY